MLRLAIVQVWLPHQRASLPELALRQCRNFLASCQTSRIQLPTFLPIRAVLLAAPLTAQKRHRCYEGSDSRRSHTPHGGSLRLLCLVFRTSNPQPRYGPEHRFRSRLNALGGSCDPGFAMNEQARRTMPPKRVRHPAGCSFASSCSPPALLRRSYLQLHVLRLHIGRTFTLLTRQHPRRTHSRESGNPEARHARPSL